MRSIRRLSSATGVSSTSWLACDQYGGSVAGPHPFYAALMATPYTGHAPLEGSLVRLRAREPADASALNELFDDPDVLEGLLVAMPQSLAGFREWMAASRA